MTYIANQAKEDFGETLGTILTTPVYKYPTWLRRFMVMTFLISWPLRWLVLGALWFVLAGWFIVCRGAWKHWLLPVWRGENPEDHYYDDSD